MSETPFSGLMAAGNTFNPCLITLRAKGYALQAESLDNGELLWSASKDDRGFSGFSPIELLGLVALWEHLGNDWNQQSPDILSEVLNEPV